MVQEADSYKETPSQTAGPYVHIGCMPAVAGLTEQYQDPLGARPYETGASGDVITLRGTVFDGAGAPVCDAMIETWQADAAGLYPGQDGADPYFSGFARMATDPVTGGFELTTIRPGATSHNEGHVQSPHLSIWIVARGINIGLQTRVYFEDLDNTTDPALGAITPPSRRDTLIARTTAPGEYHFDIRLQGPDETVFFDI